MKKKKDEFYYKNLNTCMEIAYDAALVLKETVYEYDRDSIEEKRSRMHELEQKGDTKKHKMMPALSQAFITPIEREDLVALSNDLDDITDAVEDVMLELYMCHVPEIRPDVKPMVDLLLECMKALEDVLKELKDFKHSKTLEKYIIRVNDLEEQGDQIFVENMYNLHKEEDIRTVIIWDNIYRCIENCLDTCEHAADIVGTIIMKNS